MDNISAINIVEVTVADKDFVLLCNLLDYDLNHQAENENIEERDVYSSYNIPRENQKVYIAYEDGYPIGCASFKKYEETCAEIKRVFVRKEYRSKQIAVKLMNRIKEEAQKQGIQKLLLETDNSFKQAIKFYEKYGFTKVENFPPYVGMESSVCMGMRI
ncbi:GNAT family N-acetyltransferase [Enterococcus sp. LJL99]